MRKFSTEPLLDEATLKRMNEEFLRGDYDSIDLPPLAPVNPATDPFGMNYEWLQSADEFEAAYAKVLHTFPSDLFRTSARAFRGLPRTEAFASGTDEDAFKSWIRDRFIPFCRSSQQDLLQRLVGIAEPSFEVTGDVIKVLRQEPGFDALSPHDQVLIAYAAIDLTREELKHSPN